MPSSMQDNIYIPCPLAPWNHSKGHDHSRGFSIKVDPFGRSPCYCWNTECGFKGNLLQLILAYERVSNDKQKGAIKTYNQCSTIDLGDIETLLEDDEEECAAVDPKILEQYAPFRTPWRGLTASTLEKWDVRFDETRNRILFPVYTRDRVLVGAVGRTVGSHKIKYLNYWGFKKSKVLFGEGIDDHKHVVILEGQVDALTVWQAFGGAMSSVAIMGSKPSQNQLFRIKTYYESAVIFLDNDSAGLKGLNFLIEGLVDHIPISYVWKPYHGNDPGELTAREIVSLVTDAAPIERGVLL